MSHHQASSSILTRINAALTGRGTAHKRLLTVEQVAAHVKLVFTPLDLPAHSIHWNKNLNLAHLVDLPHKALSGPVLEDKAAAHRFLKNIVSCKEELLENFDLRDIYGLHSTSEQLTRLSSLEEIAHCDMCRNIRIISMRDFDKVLRRAIPEYNHNKAIQLISASWLGEKYFWPTELHSLDLPCAIVYARRRQLPLPIPVKLVRLVLNPAEIQHLQLHYHALVMPKNAWSENSFMQFLINYRIPYARLSLLPGSHAFEVLLLPRQQQTSDTLGQGLRMAGAHDATAFLLNLTTNN